MQVKCDFCGSFMEDDEYTCPNCGATNENLKRMAPRTPQTIEELQDWYVARKLPPYETTRFFIGIDTKERRAFGIYKDGSDYVVYKNKADGSRAVRYKGNDEAYAVNEIYLRLKEEILNQKNNSARSRTTTNSGRTAQTVGAKGCFGGCLGIFGKALLGFTIFLIAILFLGELVNYFENRKPQVYDYYVKDNKAYYYEGYVGASGYEWWQYVPGDEDWTIYAYTDKQNDFPDPLSHKDHVDSVSDVAAKLGITYYDRNTFENGVPLNISNSHSYTDVHHYAPSKNSYYVVDGESYYYLRDSHGAYYGKRDNSGWYYYDDTGWEYYCDGSDHSLLGDELWYDADSYYVGSSYSEYLSGSVYDFSSQSGWDVSLYASDFVNTEWYDEYLDANDAYDRYQEEHSSSSSSSSSSSWDSDSSWDWDSGSDSWDSGSTDWDSDW